MRQSRKTCNVDSIRAAGPTKAQGLIQRTQRRSWRRSNFQRAVIWSPAVTERGGFFTLGNGQPRCYDFVTKSMRRTCVCLLLLLLACGQRSQDREKHLNAVAFREMMNRVADGWSQQNTDQALACFTEDAIYIEPPDIQFYKGHSELRPYFAALKPGTFMRFHNLWFDEGRQIGAGEYSLVR
jgi:hypothetical protein